MASAVLVTYLGWRLFLVANVPKPDTYPARQLPTGYVAFWVAVIAAPAFTVLLLGCVRRLRAYVIGWLLTFVPICSIAVLNIISFDTQLMDH